MGACAPASFKAGLKQGAALAPPPTVGQPRLPQAGALRICDLSNNDPVYRFAPMRRYGVVGCWFKGLEGLGFTDGTAHGMIASARAAGVTPGMYDFVRTYSAAEAYRFVALAKANGVCGSKGTLPPALDIEAGNAYRSGVANMVQIVKRSCGRVSIYTGLWYWTPYLGRYWPQGVASWISGYPSIIGSANYARVDVHQFTDHGFNGVISADLSSYCCGPGGYAALIGGQAKPKPVTKHEILVRRRRRLQQDYTRRHAIVASKAAHGCKRHPLRTPCKPLRSRQHKVNLDIARLHRLGV